MRLPLSWIGEFVEIKEKPDKLAEDLLFSGTKIEAIEEVAGDKVFGFEITPNRADCLSVIGIAREIAAIYRRKLVLPAVFNGTQPPTEGKITFEVAEKKLCPAYSLGVIEAIKVQDSPDWLSSRLEKSGIRSINNIVDITNYVMLETGQPMHAFDFDKLAGPKINLRRSREGERIFTLDGIERILPAGAIIIEDEEKLVDLAGLMGGQASEVDQNTSRILLHVPIYDPLTIRRTSLALGLRTEASSRFEKQLDPLGTRFAFERALFLLTQLAGGSLSSSIKTVEPSFKEHLIEIPIALIEKTLGVRVTLDLAKEILTHLEFAVNLQGQTLKVAVPSFRTDIKEPVDIVEEIARLYGYNRFPRTLPKGPLPTKVSFDDPEQNLKRILVSLGLTEIYSTPLTSGEILESLGFKSQSALKVANRLVSDYEYLRPTVFVGLLKAASLNQENFEQFSLFEVGKVFEKEKGAEGLPIQPIKVGALFYNFSFSESKGILEELFNKLNVSACFTPIKEEGPFGEPQASIFCGQRRFGVLGKIGSAVAEKFSLKKPVFCFELDLEILKPAIRKIVYQPIPKFPIVKEEISLFLPADSNFAKVAEAIKNAAKENFYSLQLLEDTTVKGRRSLLVAVSYWDPNQTLSKEKISLIRDAILASLKEIGCEPRVKQL